MAQRDLDQKEIEALLRSQRVARVAFSSPSRVYVIPLGYVWFDQALHLVTTSGQKTKMAAANTRVAFQVDDATDQRLLAWSSVTGEGAWEIVVDRAVQQRILASLLSRFAELGQWTAKEYSEKESAGAVVFARIKPIWMTGRRFSLQESK